MIPVIIAGIILPMAGCTGDSETLSFEDNRWLELLSIMPDNETTRQAAFLQTTEYAEFIQEETIDRGQEELSDMQAALTAHNMIPLFARTKYSDEEWKETVGFTIGDVTDSIVARDSPASEYQAIRGNFTAEDIKNAALNGPLTEHLEVKSYAGYEYYSWGGDRDVHLSGDWRSNVRNLGRGYRLAYVDGFALWMVWTEGLEEMIDAYEGTIPSLADNEGYRLLAAKLAEMDTVTAFFTGHPRSVTEYDEQFGDRMEELRVEGQAGQVEAFEKERLLKPFPAFATGAGRDDKGKYLVIVILNEDEKTAKENAELLKWRIENSLMIPYASSQSDVYKKWTDNDAVESMEIEHEGRFTTAKLYGRVYLNWRSFSIFGIGYFPLLLHE